jgi:hypothetical protein
MTVGISNADRYAAQLPLFGSFGQERLKSAHIAVVGMGGLGSHVCQQLAYLGVHEFTLVDADEVTPSSLNRLIGSTESDIGDLKTSVVARQIALVQPNANVQQINEFVRNGSSLPVGLDLVIGCLDNDLPRLVLTDLASQVGIPYIDAATDIIVREDRPLAFGGRVQAAGSGNGCLYCLGLLDQNQIRVAQMNDQELEAYAQSYGVPVSELKGTGPSVVTLNGVIASIAATEALMILTGIRLPKLLQDYYGHLGAIMTSVDTPSTDCGYCQQWRQVMVSKGAKAHKVG